MAVIGSFGNLLTLLSIPWAIAHKKAIMHFVPMKYTNIFIVNLAWADFLYCVTSLPTYGYMVFIYFMLHDTFRRLRMSNLILPFQFINRRDGPPCDDRCVLYGSLRYINTYASFMSIASVAVSRCLGLCYPEVANRVFKHIWVSILGIWTYAIVLVVPSVSGWYGTFGYDYDLGNRASNEPSRSLKVSGEGPYYRQNFANPR